MSEPVHTNADMTSEQFAFFLERAYEIGRRHRHREDELVRHNNTQLEENRAQRRQIKQLEALVRRMRHLAESALRDVDATVAGGYPASFLRQLLQASNEVPSGEEYRYQEQVTEFAQTILKAHGFEGAAFHDGMIGLTEAISLFLRDEVGV